MKDEKIKSPIEILITILPKGESDKLIKLLQEFGIEQQIFFIGKGTSKSEFADLFSFGLLDKDILSCIVDTKIAKEIISKIGTEFELYKGNKGVSFTISINGACSNLLKMLNIEVN